MRKILLTSMVMAVALGAQAVYAFGPPHRLGALTPEEILATLPEGAEKKASDLSVAEWTALAGAASIAAQEDRYEARARFLSFVVPGTGQFATGQVGEGIARLGIELAIIGGTAAAYYLLLPEDMQDASRGERHDLARDYWEDGDGAKLLPAMGVAAAGLTLSIVNRVLASKDAGDQARANIDSGKVTFEPAIYLSGARFGFGMRMKIH